MHPLLKPALRRGWRNLNTVQFGVAPAHAVVLGPVDVASGSFLTLLDGTRGLPLLRDEGRRMGLPEGQVDRLLDRLARAGLLDDATGGGPAAQALRTRGAALDRLRPDLAGLSVTDPVPGGAMQTLAARAQMRVQVRGAGRVGAVTAALLAGSGVGHVDVCDGGRVEPWDVAPGGLPPESVGERRADAARRVVRRAAPERLPRASSGGEQEANGGGRQVSLVVLAPRDGLDAHAPDPAACADFVAGGVPHLYAGVMEATGVVGPLVLPGMTGCAGCLTRNRTDRDVDWPRLVAQWRSGRQRQVIAGELSLSATIASLAAAHALAFLDGGLPASVGARCEVSAPGLDWRRKPLPPHPNCPCGADRGPCDQPEPVTEPAGGQRGDRPGPSREGHAACT